MGWGQGVGRRRHARWRPGRTWTCFEGPRLTAPGKKLPGLEWVGRHTQVCPRGALNGREGQSGHGQPQGSVLRPHGRSWAAAACG